MTARVPLVALLLLLAGCGGPHPTNEEAYAATLASACLDQAITPLTAESLWRSAPDAPRSCASSARTCEALTACIPATPCTGPDACEGDTLVRCVDGEEVQQPCGGGCADGQCVDREEPCEATRCLNENTLLVCVGGTSVRELDCTANLGDALCAVQDGVADCIPTASDCMDGRTECVGDDGRVCYRGVWVDFPCSDIGFLCQVPEAGMLRCIEP